MFNNLSYYFLNLLVHYFYGSITKVSPKYSSIVV